MRRLLELGLASPVDAMNAALEPYQAWIESVVGCPRPETMTLEFEFPFSHLVAEDLMAGVTLDRQCLGSAAALRRLVQKWELPPNTSPRLELHASRDRQARVTGRKMAWDPHWKETPIAVWLDGIDHAVVSANTPYVSYIEKGALYWAQWAIVNRRDAAASLNLLRQIEPPRRITVVGGRDIPLRKHALYDLQDGVHGHKHVAGPVHETAQRNPDGVRVVPSRLRGECFKATQQAGDHQAHQTRPRNVLMRIAARVPNDGEREK